MYVIYSALFLITWRDRYFGPLIENICYFVLFFFTHVLGVEGDQVIDLENAVSIFVDHAEDLLGFLKFIPKN